MNKLLWGFFWITCTVIAVAIATRLWAMRLLADKEIRQSVQVALESVAKREGWFVSDIGIRLVEQGRVTIQYRQHVRGKDPNTCYRIPLQTLELLPLRFLMLLRVLIFGLLEGFAVLLAELHRYLGVHTDEAKYLMNIPYPHPPLMRWILETTDGWQHQEMFWRIVFASLLAQGTWFVWDMGRKLHKDQRVTLCGLWLFSGAMLLQAGTLFMPTITATQTLFLCWMLTRKDLLKKWSSLIALLWLEMLFTAYQGILFAPLVYVALRRAEITSWKRWSAFLGPVVLLVLYTPTNPLTIVATGSVSGMSAGLPIEESITRVLKLWVIGGSAALSILGLYGMVKSRDYPLVLTLMLVTGYIFVGFRSYYTILFTPLLIAGLLSAPKLLKSSAFLLALQIVAGVAIFLYVPFSELSSARSIGDALRVAGVRGGILIEGSFGHEWQYLMLGPVRRYRQEFTKGASAIICLERCVGIDLEEWQILPGIKEEVWVKQE